MSRVFLVAGLFWSAQSFAEADDRAVAIVKKAIDAQGGEAVLRRAQAGRVTYKGTVMDFPCRAQYVFYLPDRFRFTLGAKQPDDSKLAVDYCVNRGSVWATSSLENDTPDEDYLNKVRQWAYAEELRSLLPLLDAKSFSLSEPSESKVKDRPALEIKVTAKGKPDLQLFFDKAAGFLVKMEYHFVAPENKKQVREEMYLDDYREVWSSAADEEIVKAAKLTSDGAALIQLLRDRTVGAEEQDKINSMIRSLGDSSFEIRNKAKDELLAKGARALPALTRALVETDPEIAGRAKECTEKIGPPKDAALMSAVIRLVAYRKPTDAVATLLAFAPSAPNESVLQEVTGALAVAGIRDGKPDPLLEKAIQDKDPERRAVALKVLNRKPDDKRSLPEARLVLPGLKWPMKEVYADDGKNVDELEVTEVQFFRDLADSNFAKP
jgi:hypothetical protein